MLRGNVLNEERRRAIIEILDHDGRVLVTDMARKFDTSQVTIRKDLEVLHAHGLVHRTHGGALPAREGALEDPSLREKEKLHRKQKMQIAQAAARLVEEGQSVVLDSGTTTTAIARELKEKAKLTVITNAINIAMELCNQHGLRTYLLGGMVQHAWAFSLTGPHTGHLLDALYHKLFSELLGLMMEDPRNIRRANSLMFVAKHLERLGDHATNVAEMVIYMVKGTDIRHPNSREQPDGK